MVLHHLLAVLVHLIHALLGMALMLLTLLSHSLMLSVSRMRISRRSLLRHSGNGQGKRERANNHLHLSLRKIELS